MLGTTTITHSPMLGVKKMVIVVFSSGIDSEINKKNIRKKQIQDIENHWNIEPFWTFWSLYTHFAWNKHNTRKKSGNFCLVLHDAWELQVALDRQKSCVSLQGWHGKIYIQTQCLPLDPKNLWRNEGFTHQNMGEITPNPWWCMYYIWLIVTVNVWPHIPYTSSVWDRNARSPR